MASQKYRNWTIIIYPESAKQNWRDILHDMNLRCIISPLHEFDTKEDGELTKPHYHIIVIFPNQVRYGTVLEICDTIGAPQHCEVVYSLGGLKEYLTHANDSDKYQYSPEDITYINCDSRFVLESAPYRELLEIISSNHFYSFRVICDFLVQQNRMDLLKYVSQNTYFIRSYLEDKCHLDYEYFMQLINDIYKKLEFNEPVTKQQIDKLSMLFGDYEVI